MCANEKMEPVKNGRSYEMYTDGDGFTLQWVEPDGERYEAEYTDIEEARKDHPNANIERLRMAEVARDAGNGE